MPFELQPTLKGELLELRPLRAEDFHDLYSVASDPLIWEQHPSRDRYKEEVFREFFREAIESGGALVAIDARDGRVIGSSRFHGYDEEKSEIEIGWTFLSRSHWGGAYNGEMKRLMLRHAFRFVERVIFLIGRRNLRSRRAVEKIGGALVGTRRDAGGQDSVVYQISAQRECMAAEQLILVDAEDRELGVGEKMQTHLEGALHRAFSIFVFDSEKRLLLQKRARTKYHSGGLWSNTACGHPRPGEATINAAHRRLREEMGFDCELHPAFSFLYRKEVDNRLVEHEYDHVFVGKFDGVPVPDAAEVEAWRWLSMKRLRRNLSERPHGYSYWLSAAVNHSEWRLLNALMRFE